MALTRNWDETDPSNSNAASEGAQEIREFKTDIRERLGVEHYSASSDVAATAETGMHKFAVVTKAFADTPYTATLKDHIILVDASGGAVTVNLPAKSGNTGKPYVIIKTDSSANAVTVDADGSETINGATTKVLSTQYHTADILCTAEEWKDRKGDAKNADTVDTYHETSLRNINTAIDSGPYPGAVTTRAWSTTYENTTGYPMLVNVVCENNANVVNDMIQMKVGATSGAVTKLVARSVIPQLLFASVCGIVPPGYFYRVEAVQSDGATTEPTQNCTSWVESYTV